MRWTGPVAALALAVLVVAAALGWNALERRGWDVLVAVACLVLGGLAIWAVTGDAEAKGPDG